MPLNHKDNEYGYTLGSDVVRDGMYIEVSDQQNEAEAIIEILYSDVSHEMSVTLFKPEVPRHPSNGLFMSCANDFPLHQMKVFESGAWEYSNSVFFDCIAETN